MGEFWGKPKLGPLIPTWEGSGNCHFPAVPQLGSLEGRIGRKNTRDRAVSVYKLKSVELHPWDAAGIGKVLPRQAQHIQAGPKKTNFPSDPAKKLESMERSRVGAQQGRSGGAVM